MIHASLFSGIGGPEVAAAMLGWDNAFHCEINPFGKAVLEYWFPNSKSYDDITKASFKEWRGRIDVLTGGFPCQPFSYAGKRGGRNDDRYLWPEMLRVIDEVRPAWVVGENVAGITTMVEGGILSDMGCDPVMFGEGDGLHRYQLRERFTIERICSDLEGLGYSVQPLLVPAAAVGAPHRRDRVFIIAHAEDADDAGCVVGVQKVEIGERNVRDAGAGNAKRLHREARVPAANANGRGSGEIPSPVHARLADGDGIIGDGRFRDATDTDGERLATALQSGLHDSEEWDGKGRPAEQYSHDVWTQGTWWDNFPTVSPVHRGNDGIPFPLDDLAIPATKWRTESLKAYGNAIVPQVMYRIFQAIEAAQ